MVKTARPVKVIAGESSQVSVVHKQGNDLTVEAGRGTVADVVQATSRATNGVVYSINRVQQRNVANVPIVR